jgi:hypothetical protein
MASEVNLPGGPLQKFAMVGTGIQGTQIAMIAARTL